MPNNVLEATVGSMHTLDLAEDDHNVDFATPKVSTPAVGNQRLASRDVVVSKHAKRHSRDQTTQVAVTTEPTYKAIKSY